MVFASWRHCVLVFSTVQLVCVGVCIACVCSVGEWYAGPVAAALLLIRVALCVVELLSRSVRAGPSCLGGEDF